MNTFFSNQLTNSPISYETNMFSTFKTSMNKPVGQTAFSSMYVVENKPMTKVSHSTTVKSSPPLSYTSFGAGRVGFGKVSPVKFPVFPFLSATTSTHFSLNSK